MSIFLIISAALLAFSNGANDNFKGFATVWGSDTLSYRQALTLATIATLLGSLASLFLADSLVQQFSGKGLVPNDVAGTPAFIVSVGLAAAVTVWLATRAGLPVSTTHALIGGLVGAGMAHGTAAVNFARLSGTFLLPLLASPLIAGLLGLGVYRLLRARKIENDCACIAVTSLEAGGHEAAALRIAAPRLVIDSPAHCEQLTEPVAKMGISRSLDRVHMLSAASICFARGVNDTPKLTALLLAASLVDAKTSIGVIAVVMALGGLLFARRVAQTMSQRMVTMDHTQGLAANLITAGLVLFASKLGLPVSTTHVSVGSIAGTGFASHSIHWTTVRNILLSWVATLPLAALIAYLTARCCENEV